MRFTILTIAAGALLTMTACSQLVSLNPLVPENLMVRNPLLAGVWTDRDMLFVIKEKDDGYAITMMELGKGSRTIGFSAHLLRVGAADILDVVQEDDDDTFRLGVHTPVRVWVEDKTLRFTLLDSDWIREEAKKVLAVQEQGKRMVVTSPPEAIAQFLLTHAADDRAYQGAPEELQRQ